MKQFDDIIAMGADPMRLAATHPLEVLRTLTNTDKHRTLLSAALGAAETEFGNLKAVDCEITHQNLFIQFFLKAGATWAILDITNPGPDPKVKVEDRVVPEVMLEGGQGIRRTFDSLADGLAQMIRIFEPVFEPEVLSGRYHPPLRRIP